MKSAFAVLILMLVGSVASAVDEDVRITVVAVLASDRHTTIDKKLNALAVEVRKSDPSLTGYRIERTTSKPVKFNQKETFALVGDLTAEVTVQSRDEKDNKIKLTIKSPHVGEIGYTTVQDKYFPILTRYQTDKDKERLILAVMVTPIAKAVEKVSSK